MTLVSNPLNNNLAVAITALKSVALDKIKVFYVFVKAGV